MSTTPPNPPTPGGTAPAPLPAPQKSSGVTILLWVVGIIVGLTLLSFGSCAVIGFYAMHKVKQAGFDSELMKKNPGYAAAKMAVTMNPDTEIVSSNDSAGTIVVRDKKTGKVVWQKDIIAEFTETDYAYLYDAIRLLAFELGLRFFTDYLAGNVYFKARHPEHNLARALVQFKLTESIESQATAIAAIIRDLR